MLKMQRVIKGILILLLVVIVGSLAIFSSSIVKAETFKQDKGKISFQTYTSLSEIDESAYKLQRPLDLREAEITTKNQYDITGAYGWADTFDSRSPLNIIKYPNIYEEYKDASRILLKVPDAAYKQKTFKVYPITIKWKNILKDKNGNLYDYQVTYDNFDINFDGVKAMIKPQYLSDKYLRFELICASRSQVYTTQQAYSTSILAGIDYKQMYIDPNNTNNGIIGSYNSGTLFGNNYRTIRKFQADIFKAGTNEKSDLVTPVYFGGLGGVNEAYLMMTGYSDTALMDSRLKDGIAQKPDYSIAATQELATTHPNIGHGVYINCKSSFSYYGLNQWSAGLDFPFEWRLTTKTTGSGKLISGDTNNDISNIAIEKPEENIPHKWDKTINIKANEKNLIKSVKVNGKEYAEAVGKANYTLKLNNVLTNQKVEVVFEKDPHGSIKINKTIK